jgi:hypothetical protein
MSVNGCWDIDLGSFQCSLTRWQLAFLVASPGVWRWCAGPGTADKSMEGQLDAAAD